MGVPQSQAPQKASNQAITDLFNAGPKSSQSQVASPSSSTFSPPPPQPARTPDPFAALASTPRQASPFQYQQSVKPPAPASGTVDLLGGDVTAPTTNLAQSTSAANDDDEWNFASSVPDTSKEVTVTNTSVNILFNISRETDTSLLIQSRISNNTPLPVSGLTLQVAASKVILHADMEFFKSLTSCRARNCNSNHSRVSISAPTRNSVLHRLFE